MEEYTATVILGIEVQEDETAVLTLEDGKAQTVTKDWLDALRPRVGDAYVNKGELATCMPVAAFEFMTAN